MTWEELLKNISIGSIVDLKTMYKDFKAKQLVLDFYGFDAVLPVKEISNNPELSFALFNTLKKGEIISLVLIDIDNTNQKLTFSTKVFRNALDDILSFTKCRTIVDNNRNTHLRIDSKFLKQNRNILDRLRGDLSSNELTFLYELIQNAVDHPNRNFNNNVNVNFEVFNNYLLVKHNGTLFTENNFESITGILYGEQIQEGERNRIGYKGIGFKSVFRFTDNAYIRSGNFSFRFSKEESGNDKPWEVLPLFQLEKDMVTKIPQFDFFNSPVAFAFEFNSDQSRNYVIRYLNQLSQNPYLLIFLENLTQLQIKAPSLTYTENGVSTSFPELDIDFIKKKAKNDEFDSIELFVNRIPHSEWLIYTKNDLVITDKEVIRELLDESITSVPAKMRHFRTPIITIALPNKTLIDEVVNLFTYLPLSNSKFKLPFLVNADFIPDLDRTDIIHNLKYNEEVLKFVAVTIQEFSQKLASKNQFEYLNTILPDFHLDYQSSGNIIVNRLLDFLPQTKITFQGQNLSLLNIAIDKSAFVNSFGLELYKTLIDSDNVPLNIVSDHKKISKLIEKINPKGVFDFSKLKEKVRLEKFKEWLKIPTNNSNFIKYLSQNKYLEMFIDEHIFLGQDSDLYKGSDLLISLGSDELEIEWLSFKKVMHSGVLSNLSDIQLSLTKYEPISFINEIICKEKKVEIITGLKNGSISFNDFYSFLSKHASNPLFPAAEIKQFPVKTSNGTLPAWSSQIYYNTNSLRKLLSEKSLPDGIYYLLDDNWSSNSNLKTLSRILGAYDFIETEPLHFLQSIITANKEVVNRFYLPQKIINANATLWAFILSAFKNLSDPQKESIAVIIKTFPVLSKKGVFKELQTLYLPSEYTDNNALETLSLQFQNSNIDFVSSDYLKDPSIDKNELRSLFKKLDVKLDTKDFLEHTLIPNLYQISPDLFVPVTRLLYENRECEPIINSVIRNSHFKLKTKEGVFKSIHECHVGSPYIVASQIPNPLYSVPLLNQISEEYSSSHLDAWQRFFSEKLKVTELINETEIIGLKLKYISDNTQKWQQPEISSSLLKEIYLLYKLGKLSITSSNLNYLKRIPLLCKGENNNNFHLSNSIHFSSAYNPTFDFEKIFGIECNVLFLSELYKFDDTPELIQFFEQIGVTQHFDQNRHSFICQNIPTANGQNKPASQLFKYELKKYVGDSNVSYEDLSQYSFNGRTLEDELKFKSKLDVASILNYINNNEPNKNGLKDLITKLLNVYIPNNDSNLINSFINQGKLLTTAKSYNSITNLHLIDESIRSGIRENEYLIDPLFSKQEQDRERYLKLFNIKNLKIEDFNPHYENAVADFEFTKRVNDRLLFLAFDSDSENYLEIEKGFKEKFGQWKINKCSKISLKYPATESKILKDDNKTFEIVNEKVFYYIGSWSDPRVNPVLVDCLSKNVLGLYKQRAFIQDMLLNDPIAIIDDFENKGRLVPDEIKRRFIKPLLTQKESNSLEPTQSEAEMVSTGDVKPHPITINDILFDATEDEIKYISEIINISRDKDGQIDANTTAKIKTLKYLKDNGYNSGITDQGRYLQVGNDKVIVRSAQKGLLYLDLYDWDELNEENTKIAIYTNNQVNLFDSQEGLFNFCKPQNTFGVLRMPNDYNLDDYNNLDDIKAKSKWHFVFIVNKDAKAAKSYEELLNLDDYNF
jgi:hypothetical protein